MTLNARPCPRPYCAVCCLADVRLDLRDIGRGTWAGDCLLIATITLCAVLAACL
mgnify:CR=1 FL=1